MLVEGACFIIAGLVQILVRYFKWEHEWSATSGFLGVVCIGVGMGLLSIDTQLFPITFFIGLMVGTGVLLGIEKLKDYEKERS